MQTRSRPVHMVICADVFDEIIARIAVGYRRTLAIHVVIRVGPIRVAVLETITVIDPVYDQTKINGTLYRTGTVFRRVPGVRCCVRQLERNRKRVAGGNVLVQVLGVMEVVVPGVARAIGVLPIDPNVGVDTNPGVVGIRRILGVRHDRHLPGAAANVAAVAAGGIAA